MDSSRVPQLKGQNILIDTYVQIRKRGRSSEAHSKHVLAEQKVQLPFKTDVQSLLRAGYRQERCILLICPSCRCVNVMG